MSTQTEEARTADTARASRSRTDTQILSPVPRYVKWGGGGEDWPEHRRRIARYGSNANEMEIPPSDD